MGIGFQETLVLMTESSQWQDLCEYYLIMKSLLAMCRFELQRTSSPPILAWSCSHTTHGSVLYRKKSG